MAKLFDWAKNNTLILLLSAAVVYLLVAGNTYSIGTFTKKMPTVENMGMVYDSKMGSSFYGTTPAMGVQNRQVVTESDISVLVKDVQDTSAKVKDQVTRLGGYVVSASITSPVEASYGYMTVRVPNKDLEGLLTFLATNAVKVVSQNVRGNDVTDQYVDLQARLDTLNTTKALYQKILDKATNVDEILRVTQAILDVQNQIDSVKGQMQYLDATSQTSVIALSMSTDEYALPYSPADPWRPEVIFKNAVRAMVSDARGLGNGLIWMAVYAVFWAPIALIALIIIKKTKKKSQKR